MLQAIAAIWSLTLLKPQMLLYNLTSLLTGCHRVVWKLPLAHQTMHKQSLYWFRVEHRLPAVALGRPC